MNVPAGDSFELPFVPISLQSVPYGNGAIGGIRTPDLCLRRALLYPAELQSQGSVAFQGEATMERVKGIGPS